jgi:glucose-1-phosphate adenylyltransferase
VIGENVTIRDTIVMGADEYEAEDRGVERHGEIPPLGIGSGSVIEGSILDKNCRVGRNVRIVNSQRIENTQDADDCVVRDGIPVVVKDAVLPDGWKL